MTDPVVDIRALAALARLEVSDTEVAKLEKEIPGILAFVEEIQKVAGGAPKTDLVRNVMREDGEPHASGLHTETLINAASAHEGNRIAVKQVVTRKK